MAEYSNNYDNLDLLDQQAEFMKAIKTDNEKEKIIIEQKSLEKGKLEVVKNLISAGVDTNLIVKASGLSKEKINSLK